MILIIYLYIYIFLCGNSEIFEEYQVPCILHYLSAVARPARRSSKKSITMKSDFFRVALALSFWVFFPSSSPAQLQTP